MSNTCIKFALAGVVLAAIAWAQPAAPQAEQQRHPAVGRQAGGVTHSADIARWTMAEMGAPGRVVKGAPYSAQAVNEINQTLADGNKIHRVTTAAVCRDSEGRTRNEPVLGGVGPLGATGSPQLIMITDPVAGLSYLLDPAKKSAVKTALTAAGSGDTMRHAPGPGATMRHAPGPGAMMGAGDSAAAKTESLGTKQIEGVQAEGTRVTTTIPAGQVGNDRPIDIVTERWYSPQLQAVVLATGNDPRMGQNSYKLTKISLTEPDHSLFEVPAGYAVTQGESLIMRHTR